jgi:hypothetical protein
MPVLLIALLALAVFGAIGILLLAAAVLETRTENRPKGTANPQDTVLAGRKHLARS